MKTIPSLVGLMVAGLLLGGASQAKADVSFAIAGDGFFFQVSDPGYSRQEWREPRMPVRRAVVVPVRVVQHTPPRWGHARYHNPRYGRWQRHRHYGPECE